MSRESPNTNAVDGKFHLLQGSRATLAVGIGGFICYIVDLGTHWFWLLAAVIFGTYFAGWLLRRNFDFTRLALLHILCGFAAGVLLWLCDYVFVGISGASASSDFLIYRYSEHLFLILGFYLCSLLSTWFFWTHRQMVTFEAIACSALVVWLLSSHRNYNLDTPKQINSLAWSWGNALLGREFAPQHFLLAIGVIFTIVLWFYLVAASDRILFRGEQQIRTAGGRRVITTLLAPLVAVALFVVFATYINKSYSSNLSKATNGVGTQANKEGQSPLGFHSAIGKTRQPAALVRLEGDYDENPWAPMLYMREGALSSFNGRELVLGKRGYDADVPRLSPGQPYIAIEKETGPFRKKVRQSIYLLAEHKTPFAIDFPQSIRLIKNPDEDKFLMAYQALSFAPTIKLDELIGEEVGDPAWDKETWAHYLRAPGSKSHPKSENEVESYDDAVLDMWDEDLRYKAMAFELAGQYESPVQKAIAISEYLSKESIYTRKPEHKIEQSADPVAPYLFGEKKRGYCVHFAHSAVYLLRLLGVPARIATGYLTDLTYAKDGHILLHLGDRHAWPEIYVRNRGWVVADIVPAQAENEPELIPDENLLEQLMSKIDPAQEFLEPPTPEEEDDELSAVFDQVVDSKILGTVLLALVLLFLFAKTWLRYGWLMTSDQQRKIKLAYLAIASFFSDLGIHRERGETRREFALRMQRSFAVDLAPITIINEQNAYSKSTKTGETELKTAIDDAMSSYDSSRGRWKRFVSFFSPLSLTRYGRW